MNEEKDTKVKKIFNENTVNAIDFKLQLISSTIRILKYFCSCNELQVHNFTML